MNPSLSSPHIWVNSRVTLGSIALVVSLSRRRKSLNSASIEKGMNPSHFPTPYMDKQQDELESIALVVNPSRRRKTLNSAFLEKCLNLSLLLNSYMGKQQDGLDYIALFVSQSWRIKKKTLNSNLPGDGQAPPGYLAIEIPLLLYLQYVWQPYMTILDYLIDEKVVPFNMHSNMK